MLYILPPPRAPNPPSPWDSILCTNNNNNNGGNGSGGSNSVNSNNNNNNGWENKRRPRKIFQKNDKQNDGSPGVQDESMDANRNPKSLSECYFAGKGTALVLPAADAQKSNRRQEAQGQGSNIQKHLQSMFYLLRPEETLKMAVKLESVHPSRTRYLVVVSRMGIRAEESCLLGIDCNERTTVGLVLKVMADTAIRLDGDGGFSVSICGRHHIFKPVSVQAMWSALQTLHKVSSKAREENYYQAGLTHGWVNYYEERIESDRSCLNEWHAMDNLESKRPPSPDSIRTKPIERSETERVIRSTLKEIMMSVDLDEVTSKYIRTRLEEDLDMDLGEYKSFIDQEMLTILGQMDAPTEIFDHVYLGSEWNASNYEELQRNGVGHILNVTREIDNFFPGTFDYLNVRVYDDEKTDLLKHWDDTFKYITKAKMSGSKVLVHCKMGISRSASVVIAYAMKAYNWDFQTAMSHVKEKRSCIKPNTNFLSQLETYQGMLAAMKNKEKLQRSKSETNLKSPNDNKSDKVLCGSEPTPVIQALSSKNNISLQATLSGQDLRNLGTRPKSWSPDNTPREILIEDKSPVSLSLEDLSQKSTSKEKILTSDQSNQNRHVLMPCDNGESYSVSPNQIVHLPAGHQENCCSNSSSSGPSSLVKERVNELEMVAQQPQEKTPPMVRAVLLKKETWDPGDTSTECQQHQQQQQNVQKLLDINNTCDDCVVMESKTVWTSSTVIKNNLEPSSINKVPESLDKEAQEPLKQPQQQQQQIIKKDGDPFSNQLDRVFDREEKKQHKSTAVVIIPESSKIIDSTNISSSCSSSSNRECPSRQNSWSSYDSAVVLSGNNDQTLSRHSSWGSGDTRVLPSRNSSWGSYDMRPRGPVHYTNENGEKILHSSSDANVMEIGTSGLFPYDKEDIPWHPGTVKRTKQKIEENNTKNGVETVLAKSSSSETLFDYQEQQPQPVVVEAVNQCLINESAITSNIDIPPPIEVVLNNSRLSVSAPETSSMTLLLAQDCSLSRSASNVSNIEQSPSVISTTQCSSVKQHRTFLENLRNKDSSLPTTTTTSSSTTTTKITLSDNNPISGIVRNLKKEFEAKQNVDQQPQQQQPPEIIEQQQSSIDSRKSSKIINSSLPSSPISIHQEKEKNEDLNFKNLVGLFETNNKTGEDVCRRPKIAKPFAAKNIRHSCIEPVEKNRTSQQQNKISSLQQTSATNNDEFKRPPMSPVVRNNNTTPSYVAAATVIAKAVKKQQQFGKSHPLARLNLKPRHNNPVYNTM